MTDRPLHDRPSHDRLADIGALTGHEDGLGPQVADPSATHAAADSVRALVDALRVADAPPEVLARAGALVDEATALLAAHGVEAMRMQGALRPERMLTGLRPDRVDIEGADTTEPAAFFPYSPIIGPLNPVAPPAQLHWDGERVTGTATFGAPYVGPPDMVHGGIIALLFDDLLGSANVCEGLGGFTGTLTVRYEAPTPLHAELELEARVQRTEGRKIITTGTITHGGRLTARAEGVFIRAAT